MSAILYHSLTHARAVRDGLVKQALEEAPSAAAVLDYICRASPGWQDRIEALAGTLKMNWDGCGIPDWRYLTVDLRDAVAYIAREERKALKP